MVGYVAGGREIPITGSLLLADRRWSVLFFVPGEAGPWGSAEAGDYDLDGSTLTFRHQLTFQGGGGRTIVQTDASTVVEVCRIDLDEATLDIHFPSGNIVKAERPPRSA